VSTGQAYEIPACIGCKSKLIVSIYIAKSMRRDHDECIHYNRCKAAFDAGRKYERDYVPFTETAPDDEELYDVMLHETEG
jgi:hypothetical protein